MNFLEWLLQPIFKQLTNIEQKLDEALTNQETLMATWSESVQAWTDYATDLKAQRDAAVAALTDAQQKASDAATALQQFQDDDAATDAQQLADQAQQFADELAAALDAVKSQEPPVEPPPLDPGNPSQAPTGDEPQVNPEQQRKKR